MKETLDISLISAVTHFPTGTVAFVLSSSSSMIGMMADQWMLTERESDCAQHLLSTGAPADMIGTIFALVNSRLDEGASDGVYLEACLEEMAKLKAECGSTNEEPDIKSTEENTLIEIADAEETNVNGDWSYTWEEEFDVKEEKGADDDQGELLGTAGVDVKETQARLIELGFDPDAALAAIHTILWEKRDANQEAVIQHCVDLMVPTHNTTSTSIGKVDETGIAIVNIRFSYRKGVNELERNFPRVEFIPTWDKYSFQLRCEDQLELRRCEECIREMATIIPIYWQLESILEERTSMAPLEHNAHAELWAMVQNFLGVQPRSIHVVQDVSLLRRYHSMARNIADHDITPFPVRTDATELAQYLQLSADVNEKLLFHGTIETACTAISVQGFDIRLAHGGNHGSGAYFAEDLNKAIPYCRGSRKIFITRVVLGDVYVGAGTHGLHRPPCKTMCGQPTCGHRLFDSVCASTPREFIVYDNYRAYPEFLVELNN